MYRTTLCSSPRPRRGFTLIELLTVIAIIGILAAILIPTVGMVRKKAKAADCVSRLRQIGTAIRLFSDENKGMVPPWRGAIDSTESSAQGVLWTQALIRYMSIKAQVIAGSPVLPELPVGTDYSQHPQYFYMCPGGMLPVKGRSWGSYTVHPVIMASNNKGPFYKISKVQRPSQVILVADGSQSDQGDDSPYSSYGAAASDGTPGFSKTYAPSDSSKPFDAILDTNNPDRDRAGSLGFLRYRHNNNVNCLFVDGHVAAKVRGSLTFANVIENK
jgi:prepilin-type N-terminal cleavage/methylation domain-containing protein/prepilin-type processing-associated H-X9-DG protein